MKCSLEICATETLNQQEQDAGTAEDLSLNVLEHDCSFICISQFGRKLIKVFLRTVQQINCKHMLPHGS